MINPYDFAQFHDRSPYHDGGRTDPHEIRMERENAQFYREMEGRLYLLSLAIAAGKRGDRAEFYRLHEILFPPAERYGEDE